MAFADRSPGTRDREASGLEIASGAFKGIETGTTEVIRRVPCPIRAKYSPALVPNSALPGSVLWLHGPGPADTGCLVALCAATLRRHSTPHSSSSATRRIFLNCVWRSACTYQHPEATSVYDDVGNLAGWRGVRLRGFDRDPGGSG